MTSGEKIKKVRLEKGLTQKELGASCKPPMQEAAIRQYELGKRNAKTVTLQRIAAALQVPYSSIMDESMLGECTEPDRVALRNAFGGSNGVMLVKKSPTEQDAKATNDLNEKIRSLSPENRAKIRELVDLYLKSQAGDPDAKT